MSDSEGQQLVPDLDEGERDGTEGSNQRQEAQDDAHHARVKGLVQSLRVWGLICNLDDAREERAEDRHLPNQRGNTARCNCANVRGVHEAGAQHSYERLNGHASANAEDLANLLERVVLPRFVGLEVMI